MGSQGFTGGMCIGGMGWKNAILNQLRYKRCKKIADYKDHLDGPLLSMAKYLIEKGELTQEDITSI